jgi:hypothetical protein
MFCWPTRLLQRCSTKWDKNSQFVPSKSQIGDMFLVLKMTGNNSADLHYALWHVNRKEKKKITVLFTSNAPHLATPEKSR